MHLRFFEDQFSKHFKPLTLTRPVWDLRIGILTIFEKWEKKLNPDLISWETNSYISDVFPSPSSQNNKLITYINSRFLPDNQLSSLIMNLEPGRGLKKNNIEIAYCLESEQSMKEIKFTEIEDNLLEVKYLWDLLELNKDQITADITLLNLKADTKLSDSKAIVSKPDSIFIANSATIEPGVIIMADDGPVYIGKNATIEAGAILKGPVAICEGSTVKMKARVYDGTTVGPVSKVGGEISHSIFHSYSNKAHDGFVGNSIFGQWCNLGADTNTSNLKNNYDFVRIKDWDTKQLYNVGFQFFGTVMGDHSKTSINCMLATGTTCGVSSNIFTSGFPPKYIPSFTWLDGENNPEFRFEKALEVMKAMMARRKVEMSPAYESMMKFISESR